MKKKIKFLIILILAVLFIILSFALGFKTAKQNDLKENYEYLLVINKNTNEGLTLKKIYTFNKNKCIDCKFVWEFENEEDAQKCYNNWFGIDSNKNLSIKNNIVSFHYDIYLGKTIEEIYSYTDTKKADECIKL